MITTAPSALLEAQNTAFVGRWEIGWSCVGEHDVKNHEQSSLSVSPPPSPCEYRNAIPNHPWSTPKGGSTNVGNNSTWWGAGDIQLCPYLQHHNYEGKKRSNCWRVCFYPWPNRHPYYAWQGGDSNILPLSCYKMLPMQPPRLSLQQENMNFSLWCFQIPHHGSVIMNLRHGFCDCITIFFFFLWKLAAL